jgi:PAS domain S-box-containing protein
MLDDEEDEETETAQSATEIPLGEIPLHSTNLLTVLDEHGTIQYESPAIERIYGFEQAELVGEPVANYFHPGDRERVLAAFERVVTGEGDEIEAVEYRHECADGTYCWVESYCRTEIFTTDVCREPILRRNFGPSGQPEFT